MLKKEFFKVELDYSKGSAYEYNLETKIPTTIHYGRLLSGKFEKNTITGLYTIDEMNNFIFMLKRGYKMNEMVQHFENNK